jgi:hypothetical protein
MITNQPMFNVVVRIAAFRHKIVRTGISNDESIQVVVVELPNG